MESSGNKRPDRRHQPARSERSKPLQPLVITLKSAWNKPTVRIAALIVVLLIALGIGGFFLWRNLANNAPIQASIAETVSSLTPVLPSDSSPAPTEVSTESTVLSPLPPSSSAVFQTSSPAQPALSPTPTGDPSKGKVARMPNKDYAVLHELPSLYSQPPVAQLTTGTELQILGEGGIANAWYQVQVLPSGPIGYLYKGSAVSSGNVYYIGWPHFDSVPVYTEHDMVVRQYATSQDNLVIIGESGDYYAVLTAEDEPSKQKGWVKKTDYYIKYAAHATEP